MGMLFSFVRIALAIALCFVVSYDLPDGCSGVLPAADAPEPRLSTLFLILAILPEPFPQIALLWRTTSASCCVLSIALSIVHPHTAMLYFGWMKQYHRHHTAFFILAIVRSIFGIVMPLLFNAERQVIIDMLTVIIDFLGKMKRPLTEEEKRAKEASRKYVLARPPGCHCPPDHCTCQAQPVRIRVKRVNTLRGTLKWFRRWLEDNQQQPVFDVSELGPEPETTPEATNAPEQQPEVESKKDL